MKLLWIPVIAACGFGPSESMECGRLPLVEAPIMTGRADAGKPNAKTEVLILLSPECPISQQITGTLNDVYSRYGNSCAFRGIVPGKLYTPEEVAAFVRKYELQFPVVIDSNYSMTEKLNGTITPEVFLLRNDTLLYSGAIDNSYRAPGKKNARTTRTYLREALDSVVNNKLPSTSRTTPIGCLLERRHS